MENVGAWLYELGRGLLSVAWSPVAVVLYVVGYIVVLLLSAEALHVARYNDTPRHREAPSGDRKGKARACWTCQ
jgi:hypothetical protein